MAQTGKFSNLVASNIKKLNLKKKRGNPHNVIECRGAVGETYPVLTENTLQF